MPRLLVSLVVIVVVAYLAACATLFFRQRALIFLPPQSPTRAGDKFETLSVPGAVLRISTRPLAGAKAVLYFGGNGEDVSFSLPDLAAAFPDRALYLPHYRGYCGSTGDPSEDALFADALVLFDKVHAAHPDVVLIGRSLGTGLAVRVASVRPVKRLVLVTPYDSLVEIAEQQYPLVPVSWLMLDRFESWRYAPRVAAPTLLLAAENDQIIPRASTDRLYSHFGAGVAAFTVIPGVDHNSISSSPDYVAALRDGG